MEQQSDHLDTKLKLYFGIDNGTTGAIAAVNSTGVLLSFTPMHTRLVRNYTKAAQNIRRLDIRGFSTYLNFMELDTWDRVVAVMERPMINPTRFKQSVAAARFYEATLIVLEQHHIPVELIDSKQWQKHLLQQGLEKDELKAAAVQKARELFPNMSETIDNKTADAICIAEWARRVNL